MVPRQGRRRWVRVSRKSNLRDTAGQYNPGVEPVLTASQMAALDAYAIGTLGLDSRILMSNAAREVLAAIHAYFPSARRLAILAGPGNNGGDGIALGYYARQSGYEVELYLCGEEDYRASEDGAYFLKLCAAIGLTPYELNSTQMLHDAAVDADLIVDALFGTGLTRAVEGYFADVMDALGTLPQPIVSIDCPSGLDCTTGIPRGACVHADLTVTFGMRKLGFFHPAALELLGELALRDIGLGFASPLGIAGMSVGDFLLPELLQPRRLDTHKGDFGRVLIVAGHEVYPGAPRLAALGALACGAGLVRLVVPQCIHGACCDDPSVMCAPHSMDSAGGFSAEPDARLLEWLDWADALVVGPGLGAGDAVKLAASLIAASKIPSVVDADALRALPVAREADWPLVLTPHPGELARMMALERGDVLEHWFEAARDCARKHRALVLAKSAQCALADGELLLFPHRGHPALATGGTGDVLSGMIGALLALARVSVRETAQRHSAEELRSLAASAAICAVNIHSSAATLCAAELGESSVSAYHLAQALPKAMKALIEAARQGMLGGGSE
jgi:ADP-dependent NAD(P)H-hydrate dehydratase / NAD(P)H-hydrate epimerase